MESDNHSLEVAVSRSRMVCNTSLGYLQPGKALSALLINAFAQPFESYGQNEVRQQLIVFPHVLPAKPAEGSSTCNTYSQAMQQIINVFELLTVISNANSPAEGNVSNKRYHPKKRKLIKNVGIMKVTFRSHFPDQQHSAQAISRQTDCSLQALKNSKMQKSEMMVYRCWLRRKTAMSSAQMLSRTSPPTKLSPKLLHDPLVLWHRIPDISFALRRRQMLQSQRVIARSFSIQRLLISSEIWTRKCHSQCHLPATSEKLRKRF